MMTQIKERTMSDDPPAIATDGNDCYREAVIETWGKVPEYSGRGRPPVNKKAQPQWKYLQVIKYRSGGRVVDIQHNVVFGDPKEVCDLLGLHTAYVERSHLTSRQMNGRVVRKSLSFSKEVEIFKDSCAWEDCVYNFARPHKSLRIAHHEGLQKWIKRSPAMAAGLTDHLWTMKEIMMAVVAPDIGNSN